MLVLEDNFQSKNLLVEPSRRRQVLDEERDRLKRFQSVDHIVTPIAQPALNRHAQRITGVQESRPWSVAATPRALRGSSARLPQDHEVAAQRRDRAGAVVLPGLDGQVGGAAAELEDAGLGVEGDRAGGAQVVDGDVDGAGARGPRRRGGPAPPARGTRPPRPRAAPAGSGCRSAARRTAARRSGRRSPASSRTPRKRA